MVSDHPQMPGAGDVIHVGRTASVQFAGAAAFDFRVIRTWSRETYSGWLWLEGYQLDSTGQAVQRRTIFVQVAGLLPQQGVPAPGRSPARKGRNVPSSFGRGVRTSEKHGH